MLRAQTLVTLKDYQSALFDVNRLMELNPLSDVYRNLQARLKTQLVCFFAFFPVKSHFLILHVTHLVRVHFILFSLTCYTCSRARFLISYHIGISSFARYGAVRAYRAIRQGVPLGIYI